MATREDVFPDRYGEDADIRVVDAGDGLDLQLSARPGVGTIELVLGIRNDDLDRLESAIRSVRSRRGL